MVPPMLHPRSQGIFGEGNSAIIVLLIIDNAPGHPQYINIEDENVQVVFFLPNTTSLLQPLDQGIIKCVKASYANHDFEMFRAAINSDTNFQFMECWKSFSISDAINLITPEMDELKPETVNACWKDLWSDVVNDFKGFPVIEGEDHPNK
jgi:hypothetical protein